MLGRQEVGAKTGKWTALSDRPNLLYRPDLFPQDERGPNQIPTPKDNGDIEEDGPVLDAMRIVSQGDPGDRSAQIGEGYLARSPSACFGIVVASRDHIRTLPPSDLAGHVSA